MCIVIWQFFSAFTGTKESKVKQPRHILRGGRQKNSDRKNSDAASSSENSSSHHVSYEDVSKRSACEIYGLVASADPNPPPFDFSLWVSGSIRDDPYDSCPGHPIQRVPTALHLLDTSIDNNSQRWFLSKKRRKNNSQRSVLITASTAIRTLSGFPKIMYGENEWAGVIFSIFDPCGAGHYSLDDVKALTHIYGLDDYVQAKDFKKFICKKQVDLGSVRYPFQLLKLISYFIDNSVLKSKPDASLFMSAIFERTFGKAPSWKRRVFGHIGIVEYLKGDSEIDTLSVKHFKTLTQLWGLKGTDRERQMVKKVVKEFGNSGHITYGHLYLIYFEDRIYHQYDVPRLRDPSDLFHLIDTDNNGFISEDEFHYFAGRFNQELSNDEVAEMIVAFDLDGDGLIGFEDFRQVMQPILVGTSWEVWLVGVAFAIFLAAKPTLLM